MPDKSKPQTDASPPVAHTSSTDSSHAATPDNILDKSDSQAAASSQVSLTESSQAANSESIPNESDLEADASSPASHSGGSTDPNSKRSCHRPAFGLLAIIVLLLACLPSLKERPELPVPEYTLIVPFERDPVEHFINIMERHAALTFTIIESGASDDDLHIDMIQPLGRYCNRLQSLSAWDWTYLGDQGWRPDQANWRKSMEKAWLAKSGPAGLVLGYHGPAYEAIGQICEEVGEHIDPYKGAHFGYMARRILRFWWRPVPNCLLSAGRLLQDIYAAKRESLRSLEGSSSRVVFSPDHDDVGLKVALNCSIAKPVLQALSYILSVPGRFHKDTSAVIREVNESLHGAAPVFETLLEFDVDQWLALNRRNDTITSQEAKSVSRIDRWRLAKSRSRIRAQLSVIEKTRDRFSGLAADALAVTSEEADQLKSRMDELIAGRGWTCLGKHGESWVLNQSYIVLRPERFDWLVSHAEETWKSLDEFSQRMLRQRNKRTAKELQRIDDRGVFGFARAWHLLERAVFDGEVRW